MGRVKTEYVYAMLDDDYDQIVFLADTITELAQIVGVKRDTIDQTMSRAKRLGTKCKYIRILLDDEEL